MLCGLGEMECEGGLCSGEGGVQAGECTGVRGI